MQNDVSNLEQQLYSIENENLLMEDKAEYQNGEQVPQTPKSKLQSQKNSQADLQVTASKQQTQIKQLRVEIATLIKQRQALEKQVQSLTTENKFAQQQI